MHIKKIALNLLKKSKHITKIVHISEAMDKKRIQKNRKSVRVTIRQTNEERERRKVKKYREFLQ